MTRAELIEHMAWKLRDSRDVKKAAQDLLSELDRSPKWRDVADRVAKSPSVAWVRFLYQLTRRVEEIR